MRLPDTNFLNLWQQKAPLLLKDGNLSLAIGLVWLFHLSGIIGVLLGYEQWFLEKTPFNLLACFVMLLAVAPIRGLKHGAIVFFFVLAGIFVEWVGTTYGIPFGQYYYGNNLGIKLAGVPLLIGVNWAMLILITGSLATRMFSNKLARVLTGAALMVFLDLFIEPNASNFDFWHWANDIIPSSNYIAWFVIAAGLHWIFQLFIEKLNFKFSLHLYLAQLVFFVSLYVNK